MTRERKTFLKVFLEHEAELRAYIGALIHRADQREEVFQDTAVALWESFDRYDPDRPFLAWARGVAKNKVRQLCRREARQATAFSPDTLDAIEAAYEQTDDWALSQKAALARCMSRLPSRQHSLLKLRYETALKMNEIAENLGMSFAAAHRALVRIRKALQDCVRKRLATER